MDFFTFAENMFHIFLSTKKNSVTGGGGAISPLKVLICQNLGKIPENLGKILENPGKNGAHCLQKNTWEDLNFWRSNQKTSSWSWWEKICRQKSHRNFSDKIGEIRAKILRSPKTLPDPTPITKNITLWDAIFFHTIVATSFRINCYELWTTSNGIIFHMSSDSFFLGSTTVIYLQRRNLPYLSPR